MLDQRLLTKHQLAEKINSGINKYHGKIKTNKSLLKRLLLVLLYFHRRKVKIVN